MDSEEDIYNDFPEEPKIVVPIQSTRQFYDSFQEDKSEAMAKEIEQRDKEENPFDPTNLDPKKIQQQTDKVFADKKKLKKALSGLKGQGNIVSDTLQYMEANQDLKQDAMMIAGGIKGAKKKANEMDISAKKMQQKVGKAMLDEHRMKKFRKEGEVKCVVISLKGKIQPSTIVIDDLDEDAYNIHPLVLKEHGFIVLCNVFGTGRNKLATELLEMEVLGVVTLVKVNSEEVFIPITAKEFEEILGPEHSKKNKKK